MLRFGSHNLEISRASYIVSGTVGAVFNPIPGGNVEDSTFLVRNPRLCSPASVRNLVFMPQWR